MINNTNHSLKVNDEYNKYFGYYKWIVKGDITELKDEMTNQEKQQWVKWCKKEYKVRVYDMMGIMVYTDKNNPGTGKWKS